MAWYYENNGEAKGPMSLEKLLPLITSKTFVWTDDSDYKDWCESENHPELRSLYEVKDTQINVKENCSRNSITFLSRIPKWLKIWSLVIIIIEVIYLLDFLFQINKSLFYILDYLLYPFRFFNKFLHSLLPNSFQNLTFSFLPLIYYIILPISIFFLYKRNKTK